MLTREADLDGNVSINVMRLLLSLNSSQRICFVLLSITVS